MLRWKLKDEGNGSDQYPLWIAVKEIIPLEEKDSETDKVSLFNNSYCITLFFSHETWYYDLKEQDRMRMEREHLILKTHPHKNIVSYLGRIDDIEQGVTNFVMELCTTDLKRFSSKRKLNESEIAVIMREVLMAIDHLHKNDVLHR